MTKETLNDILNDEPTAEVETPQAEAPAEEPKAEEVEEISASKAAREKLREDETSDGPVRDEKGRFAPKGEKPEEAPPAEAPPASEEQSGNIPIAALKDERAKRQALEAELQQMRAYYAQMQQQAQPQPEQPTAPPDRWEDPEGYDRWLVQQVTAAAEQKATEAFHYQRIATAAVQFKADKPDYDETIQVFGQMANVNPGLIQQMQQSVNPAQFAYDTAKQAIAINQAGSLDAYIQQEAARLAAAKAAEQPLASVADKLPAPPTISNDRSVGPRTAPQFSGPTPITDILS